MWSFEPQGLFENSSQDFGFGKPWTVEITGGLMDRKIRLLIGKPGLDGHDRGAKIIARGFSDAGFEVIYSGLHQTPEQIVAMAIQEGVDAIGLSILSGHMSMSSLGSLNS